MNRFTKFLSRKLFAFVAGIGMLAFGAELGLTADDRTNILGLLVAYLVAQGAVDTVERARR